MVCYADSEVGGACPSGVLESTGVGVKWRSWAVLNSQSPPASNLIIKEDCYCWHCARHVSHV